MEAQLVQFSDDLKSWNIKDVPSCTSIWKMEFRCGVSLDSTVFLSPSNIRVTARRHYEKLWGRKAKLVEWSLSIWGSRLDTQRIISTDEKLWKRQRGWHSRPLIDGAVLDGLHFLRVNEWEKHCLEWFVKWPLRRPPQSKEWRSWLGWKVEQCIFTA